MRRAALRILAAVALLLGLLPAARAGFYLAREGRVALLKDEIAYRVDNGESFPQVAATASGWTSQKLRPYSANGGPDALWVRFDLPSDTPASALVNIPLWEHEEYFIVRDGVLVDHRRAGSVIPWNERATGVTMVPNVMGGFVALDARPGTRTTVYARLRSENRRVVAEFVVAHLWDAARVLDGERRDRMFQGLYFGVILFLIAYNLVLFLVVREPSFFYYVLMESAFSLTWGELSGLSYEYLSPDRPDWVFHYVWLGATVGAVGLWQFLRHYLDTARHMPRADRILRALVVFDITVLPATFLPVPPELLSDAVLLGTPVTAVVLIGVVGGAVKLRLPSSLNLFAAMACIGVGFTIFASEANGLLPRSGWLFHAGQIGSALAGVTLSFGLSFRLERERTKIARLRRFLSPKVSELIASGQMDDPLATHRRDVVTLFADLRGFTAFCEAASPDAVIGVLRAYHAEVGRLAEKYEGTIEHFAGDGVMVVFNDPAELPDPALSAVRMGIELRDAIATLAEGWRAQGHALGCGIGIAQGSATIGTIGFPGRQDYGVIGPVNNLAARLCAQAQPRQVLVAADVFEGVQDVVSARALAPLVLKGFQQPVQAYDVIEMRRGQDTTGPQAAPAAAPLGVTD